MLESLKEAASQVFGGGEELDRIYQQPITQLRIELKQAFQLRVFTQEQYDDFVSRLVRVEGADIGAQQAIAATAAEKREVESVLDIELDTPGKQLLWAATLTRMMDEGKSPIAKSTLWQQLQDTIAVRNEQIRTARVIATSLQNDDVTFAYGQPGSWFYHDPIKNHINLDLYYSLMVGFEHVRSVNLHEEGHSELSMVYPEAMQELFKKVEPYILRKKGEKRPKLTKEQQIELARDAIEWKLRHRFWNSAEDNCVNQFAANMSDLLPQDFGYSINHMNVTLMGFGEALKRGANAGEIYNDRPAGSGDDSIWDIFKDKKKKEAEEEIGSLEKPLDKSDVKKINAGNISKQAAGKLYSEMTNAVLLAFFQANGLFSDKDKNWNRLGVFKEDINQTIDVSGIPEAKGKTAFEYLMALMQAEDGVRHLQPLPADRHFGKTHYREKVRETSLARGKIMDQIWDVYFKKFADVLINEFQNEMEKRLEQKKQDQKNQDKSGQGQSSQGQGGKDDQGEWGESDGGDGIPMDMDDDLDDAIGDMSENPGEGREQEGTDENKNKGAGNDQDDGAGDKKKEKPVPGGWDQDPDQKTDPKKAGDLKNKEINEDKISDEKKKEMKDAAKDMPKGNSMRQPQGGRQRGVDLASLAKGDWSDFNKRVLQLAPVINQVAESFRSIRKEQRRQMQQQSKTLDFTAEDGDVLDRLDRDKMLETRFRQAAHEKLTTDDFKKFREDKTVSTESTIEIVAMIDGSGSMPSMQLGNGVSAMDAALQSSVIVYMAARKAGIDAYIVMWGDPQPLIIATPDSNLREVGKKLEMLKRGTGSGTNLAPGIVNTVEAMALHRNKNGTMSGSSHLLVFSDGDIGDFDEAVSKLEIVSRNAKNLSIDVAVLNPGSGQTYMERAFQTVIDRTGGKLVGLMRGTDPSEIPLELSRLMLKRVRSFKVKTEPDAKKRERLRQLHKKLD